MSHDHLPPAEKGKVTRLINEGCELKARMAADEERLKAIKAELWPYAEAQMAATGETSCTFAAPKGSYTVTKVVAIKLNRDKVDHVRDFLGDRFDHLVEVKETVSFKLTNAFKRILDDPQPQEADLSEDLNEAVDRSESTRVDLKPAA